jgi:hypothetical protein
MGAFEARILSNSADNGKGGVTGEGRGGRHTLIVYEGVEHIRRSSLSARGLTLTLEIAHPGFSGNKKAAGAGAQTICLMTRPWTEVSRSLRPRCS